MVCNKCGFNFEEGNICPNCNETVENTDVEVVTDPGAGKGKAALILGIVSIALSTVCSLLSCGLTSFPAIVTSIIGMILGSSAKKLSANAGYTNKNAKIGFILSLVVLILGIIGTIVGIIFTAFGGGMSMMANGLASTTPTYYY